MAGQYDVKGGPGPRLARGLPGPVRLGALRAHPGPRRTRREPVPGRGPGAEHRSAAAARATPRPVTRPPSTVVTSPRPDPPPPRPRRRPAARPARPTGGRPRPGRLVGRHRAGAAGAGPDLPGGGAVAAGPAAPSATRAGPRSRGPGSAGLVGVRGGPGPAVGQARRSDETAREFAARAGDRLPTQSRELLALASAADAALFGADAIDDGEPRPRRRRPQTVQAIVADQVPRWRRASTSSTPAGCAVPHRAAGGDGGEGGPRRRLLVALEAVPHALAGVAEVVAQARRPASTG